MVFQNYALFPHLSVERNIAFGLEQRRTPRTEIAGRVRTRARPRPARPRRRSRAGRPLSSRAASASASRWPARSCSIPAILLLDEPLGAIDLQLRKEMQLELKALNKQLGTTFLYVTHDQEEALTMSDRIAVMSHARVAQLGTPAEIYENPRTAFVAKFIGESNFLDGRRHRSRRRHGGRSRDGRAYASASRCSTACARTGCAHRRAPGMARRVSRRMPSPPARTPFRASSATSSTSAKRCTSSCSGPIRMPDMTVALRNEGQLINPLPWRRGDAATVAWRPEDCQILEDE